MKREIKFRGLRTDGKGWVIGSLAYLFDDKSKPYIMPSCNSAQAAFMDGAGLALGGFVPVIPETVGQFTGLKDSYGVEIYEGDTVQTEYFEGARAVEWMALMMQIHSVPLVKYQRGWIKVTGNIHEPCSEPNA